MQHEEKARQFLAGSKQRLEGAGFKVIEGASHDGRTFDLVGIRKRMEATKFGAWHTFFVFSTLPSIDTAGVQDFSAACFKYVEEAHRSGMPRGMGKGVACFPVALVPSVDAATSEAVRRQTPKKHYAAMEMPVVVDLGTGELHYLEKTPLWGAAYYRGARKQIKELLAP